MYADLYKSKISLENLSLCTSTFVSCTSRFLDAHQRTFRRAYWYVMSTDVHQDFLMDLVDVVSNCFGEYHFVLDCVHSRNRSQSKICIRFLEFPEVNNYCLF